MSVPAEVLDELAKSEHLRWLKESRASGWAEWPVKLVTWRVSPAMVGWEQLDDVDHKLKHYDR